MAYETKPLGPDSWLLDSAASVHISDNKSLFSSYESLKNHKIIGIGSRSAEGQGTVQLVFEVRGRTTNVTLERVLYLPSSPYNIISLGKLHRAGHRVDFPLGGPKVAVYSEQGVKIMQGRNIDNIYALENVTPKISPPTNDHVLTVIGWLPDMLCTSSVRAYFCAFYRVYS
ncbi:unnamed protein product [Mycena citricolor]|uniref:Retrovirus-related Pol polyprotein from transposon TNT 1-94-like beta-barrel domain-containing protein n=1 Tax=Mycena citricolor TaxID=2018698 RepID=A0AAD2JZ66_9AGAR|nr:unnamed protein product [Mycena citricolor]